MHKEKKSKPGEWNEAKEEMVTSLETTKTVVEFERGQVEVSGYYFRGDRDAERAEVKEKGERDGKGRLRTVYIVGEKEFGNENEAKRFARESDLIRRAGNLADVEESLQGKQKLTARDWGALDAAHVIATLHVHDVNLAVESGASGGIDKAIKKLARARDDLAGLNASKTEAEIKRLQPELPTAHRLEILTTHRDVAAGLEGKETTYLGQKAAEVTVQLVKDVVEEPPRLDEVKSGALDLEKAAQKRVKQILTHRAERMYQDSNLSPEDFGKAAEVMKKRDESRDWDLLKRAKYHHEAVARLLSDLDLLFAEPGKDTLSTVARRLLPQHEVYELLDDQKIRNSLVTYYHLLRRGEFFWNGDGRLFRVSSEGKVEPSGPLPLHERLAAEILYGMGVHPDPFSSSRQTKAAWRLYKANEGVRCQYLYDRDGEAGKQRTYWEQFLQARLVRNNQATLAVEHPRKLGVFLLGDQMQMQGIRPEDIRSNADWVSLKEDPERTLWDTGYYLVQLRKGRETYKGFAELFKQKRLIIGEVFKYLADKFTYIGANDLDIKWGYLAPFYAKGEEPEIRQLEIAAATAAKVDKGIVFQAVMEKGVGMGRLFQLTGLYFTTIAGTGLVPPQIEAMIRTYLANHPGASRDDDETWRYILEKTGLDKDERIPNMYQEWRDAVLGNLARFEGFSKEEAGNLLSKIKEIGLSRYRFRDPLSSRLAELLINDPVNQILDSLYEIAQEKNWKTFSDEFAMLEKRIKEGDLPTVAEREDLKKRLIRTYSEEGLNDLQFQQLSDRWEGLIQAEIHVEERLATIGGQFNETGWSLPILATWFLGELPLLPFPKWDPRSDSFHRWILKWGGINPVAVESTAAALFTWATANLVTTGSFSLAGLTSVGGFWGILGLAHGVTILSRLLNEGKAPRFTRTSFENYPFPNDHTLGIFRFAWWGVKKTLGTSLNLVPATFKFGGRAAKGVLGTGLKVVTFVPKRVIRLIRR